MRIGWCWLAMGAAAGAAMAGSAATAAGRPAFQPPEPASLERPFFERPSLERPSLERPSLERQVLDEINRLRADPAGYAESLRRYRGYYHANLVTVPGSDSDYETEEGLAPVDEAIDYLERQAPASPYADSIVLGEAARDHGTEQAGDGGIGHVGRDGSDPGERVARRGGGRYVAEVITYGSQTAADVVRQLIVDDGVPDRGHRRLLFAPDFRYAGVACAPHPAYREACIVDLARTPDARSRWPRIQFADNRLAAR